MQEILSVLVREYGSVGAVIALVIFLLRKEMGMMLTGRSTDPTIESLKGINHEIQKLNISVCKLLSEHKDATDEQGKVFTRISFLCETIKDEIQRR